MNFVYELQRHNLFYSCFSLQFSIFYFNPLNPPKYVNGSNLSLKVHNYKKRKFHELNLKSSKKFAIRSCFSFVYNII